MADVANPDAYIPNGEYNPHNVRPWHVQNEYGTLCVVYADCEQDALDEAADADMLKAQALDDEETRHREIALDGEGVMRLGNAGEPFDSINLHINAMPNLPPDYYEKW